MAPLAPSTDTYQDLHREGLRLLSEAGIANAAQETVWLLEEALHTSALKLRLEGACEASPEQQAWALLLFKRRAAGEPLQYLLGTQEFCGLEFEVGPEVLIPRPETELLVQEVVGQPAGAAAPLLVDIGTGSGCIAVALARALHDARLYATDLSAAALQVARRNAVRHGVEGRIVFLEGDLFAALDGLGLEGRLDAVISNPPYIADSELAGLQREVTWEPRAALAGGPEGLTVHYRILQSAGLYLKPGGMLALEMGQGQAGPLREMAGSLDWMGTVYTLRDPAGIERVLCLTKG